MRLLAIDRAGYGETSPVGLAGRGRGKREQGLVETPFGDAVVGSATFGLSACELLQAR